MSQSQTVTLATNCWEEDWQDILTTDRLELLDRRNCYTFAERILTINNVSDPERVCAYAEQAVTLGRIDRYLLLQNYSDEALSHFKLAYDDFKGGYYYSIAPLVALLQCQTKHLLYFTGDSVPTASIPWIERSLTLFSDFPRVKVVNLSWNNQQAAAESTLSLDDFYIGFGFSDQCFLVQTADFSRPIYQETHVRSARYPRHAGESFEKRVDSWMRNNSYYRATYRHASYSCALFPSQRRIRAQKHAKS